MTQWLDLEMRDACTREYERIGSELVQNESMGDGRVNLYLGLWGVAVAGVAAVLSNDSHGEQLRPLVTLALVVLSWLGVVTLVRIVRRNQRTDELVDALVRFRYLMLGPSRPLYDAAAPWKDWDCAKCREPRVAIKKRRRAFWQAGLLQPVYLANSGVPPMLGLVWLEAFPVLLVVASGGLALLLQIAGVFAAYGRDHENRAKARVRFERAVEDQNASSTQTAAS